MLLPEVNVIEHTCPSGHESGEDGSEEPVLPLFSCFDGCSAQPEPEGKKRKGDYEKDSATDTSSS